MMHTFQTIPEVLLTRASQPNKTALRFLEDGEVGTCDEWSYERLDRAARGVAQQLLSRVEPGSRALLLYPPGPEFVVGFFGCLYAGVIAVPVYPPDPSRLQRTLPRLEKVIKDAGAALVLSTQSITEMSSTLAELSPVFAALSWLPTDDIAPSAAEINLSRITPESVAFLQYTSGSTGDPKGVIVTHANLLHNLALIKQNFGNTSESRGVIWLPSYHDMGLIGGILQPIYIGGEVTLFSPLDFLRKPSRWLQAISHFRATTSGGPDFAYRLCTRKITEAELDSLDLSSWRVAFTGAEPVRADTLREFSQRFSRCGFSRDSFLPVYGLAESTLIVTGPRRSGGAVFSLDAEALSHQEVRVSATGREYIGCGSPLDGLEVKIVDPESHTVCPPEKVGEIWIRGPSVARGYWGNDAATQATFHATLQGAQYLRSGDLGLMLDGELIVTGRSKDLIIVRGKNFSPQDLEATAQESHPAIRQGCIAAFGVELGGEERVALVAEVDPKKGGGDTRAVVLALREAIAKEHDLSVAVVSLLEPGTLPKTSSGKIQRYACRDGLKDGSLSALFQWSEGEETTTKETIEKVSNQPSHWAPLAEKLIQCTAAHAKCPAEQVQPTTTFSSLGLGSIELIELTVKLEELLQRPLPTMTLYHHPSIESLLLYLDREKNQSSPQKKTRATDRNGAAIYHELDKAREKIDKRNQNYQFDLEESISWSRIQEPGMYLPEQLLHEIGVDVPEVKKNPEAWELLQWSMAIGICHIFELFEVNIIFFCETESSHLGQSNSVRLLCEEEDKHIQLFRRIAKHLRAQRPEDAKRLKELFRDTEKYCLSIASIEALKEPKTYHYFTWLWTLFFEEYTVYFHESLLQSPQSIQPTWLDAHAAHRREEVQHIVTDTKHLDALALSKEAREAVSRQFVQHILQNFRYQFSIDAPARLLKERFPGLRCLREEREVPTQCLKTLSANKIFGHSGVYAPTFGDLSRQEPKEATHMTEAHKQTREPLAIIGISCRLPGGVKTPAQLWRLFIDGQDVVTEVPAERWSSEEWYDADPNTQQKMYTKWGGFLDGVAQFDPAFFGILPREAKSMDPQQRLLLETTWDALEDASVAPSSLSGSRTGVFTGICNTDYNHMTRVADITPWSATGGAFSIASGRVSYLLNLKGPSMSIDTACSSSLVALHLACQSLRLHESDLAIVSGVNVLLIPDGHVAFSALRAMSPTGRCKAFDSSADGYVRSEGCVSVIVKRLSEAQRDGDQIWAVIRGTATNQDGRSNGLTAPHGPAQEEAIRMALADAGLRPDDVGYLEAHGTGTPIGDPIELSALAGVFRERQRPVWVGSSKTNIGHTEGASGLVGVLKAAMTLRYGLIPKHLHFQKPTSHFDWSSSQLQIPTENIQWSDASRIAGVNSFGFGGSNAHAILEAPPSIKQEELYPAQPSLFLSAKTEGALRSLAGSYAKTLSRGELSPADVCYTSMIGREAYRQRAAFPASAGLVELLRQFSSGSTTGAITHEPLATKKVAFLFTGQGAQFPAMAKALYKWPVFRDAIERCAAILDQELEIPLTRLLLSSEDAIHETRYTQPAMVSLGIALTELWRSFGVEPAVVLGHSVGEITAAWAAGVFSLEDALRLIAARGRLMHSMPRGGAMLSLDGDEPLALEVIEPFGEQVSIAAVNAARQVVVSGYDSAITEIETNLKARGVRTKRLVVSHAFHSPMMDPMLDDFEAVIKTTQRQRPQKPLLSNLTGRLAGAEIVRPGYWSMHVRSPVRFAESISTLLQMGVDTLLEIGPQPHLLGLAAESSVRALLVPSMRKGTEEETLWSSVAKLWSAGYPVMLSGLWAPYKAKKVSLPTHPYERQRYWLDETPQPQGKKTSSPWLGTNLNTAGQYTFEALLSIKSFPWLADHKVAQSVVIPGVGWLEMMRAASAEAGHHGALSGASFERPVRLQDNEVQRVQSVVNLRQKSVEVFVLEGDTWARVASANLSERGEEASFSPDFADECNDTVPTSELYEALRGVGLEYGPAFASLTSLRRSEQRGSAELSLPESIQDALSFPCHPAILDAALHACAGLLLKDAAMWLPIGVDSFSVQPTHENAWQVQVALKNKQQDLCTADILLFDRKGQPVASIKGLQLQRVRRPSATSALSNKELYQVEWLPSTLAPVAIQPGRFWVVGEGELAERLAKSLPGEVSLVKPSERPTGSADIIFDLSALTPNESILRDTVSRLQSWVKSSATRRLLLFTSGAQPTPTDQVEVEKATNQAALWGIGRTLAQEHPELSGRLIDLDPVASMQENLDAILYEATEESQEQTLWRARQRKIARLNNAPRSGMTFPANSPWRLQVARKGALDALHFASIAQRRLSPNEVEIEVEATGLNFRDVLNALGMYPGEAGPLGGECAGVISAIGSEVKGLRVGDSVVALAAGTFGDVVTTDARLVARRPESLGAAEAATIPIAFMTAWYGLFDLANLQPGQKILIHAAAGGVGMAAVQLAQMIGAEIFATASATKQDTLRQIGLKNIYSSRDTNFASQIPAGSLHAVLNALTGPFIPASMKLLAPSGSFLEMGKAELWDDEKLAAYPGVKYQAFDLTTCSPERLGEILQQIMSLVEKGTLRPLPRKLFLLQDATEAFRYMAQAKHIGKVVLTRRAMLDPTMSYVVTGASGGLGRQALLSLSKLGAKKLIAVGRSSIDAKTMSALAEAGASLRHERIDLSTQEGLRELEDLVRGLAGELRGVIHAAGVLGDRLFSAQTEASFAQVFLPKVDAALALHHATSTQSLDFFVMYSSISATLGAGGQSNYAAANAALDAISATRHALGLPAISIAWGPWDGDGMVASLDERAKKRLSAQGVSPIQPSLAMRYFESLLFARSAHLIVADINAPQMKTFFTAPLLALFSAAPTNKAETKAGGLRAVFQAIKEAPQPSRAGLLLKELQAATSKVMGLPQDLLEPKRPLRDLGLDSLVGVELQNMLSQALDKPLPRTTLLERPTLESLATYLSEEFFDGKATPIEPQSLLSKEIAELEGLLS